MPCQAFESLLLSREFHQTPYMQEVVAGTPDYMDPEFVNNRRPSAEADVFSFGVVLLELACGRRPTAARPNATATPVLLIDWIRDMYHKNTVLGAADRRLDGEFDDRQMRRVLVAGLWCTHHDQSQQPPIATVMDLLRRQDAELPILPEMHSPATASVRSLEEIAYGDLDFVRARGQRARGGSRRGARPPACVRPASSRQGSTTGDREERGQLRGSLTGD